MSQIKVNEADFSDPGPEVAGAISPKGASTTDSKSSALAQPATQAPVGDRHSIMKFAFFFIDRPVFAAVLSIVTVIVGRDFHLRAADCAVPGYRAADGDR